MKVVNSIALVEKLKGLYGMAGIAYIFVHNDHIFSYLHILVNYAVPKKKIMEKSLDLNCP